MKNFRNDCGDVLALICIALIIVSALAQVFEVRDPQVGEFLRQDGIGFAFVLGFGVAALYGQPEPHGEKAA